MLKVNVGMSRKLSKDFNSTGFSVNLEGEVCGNLDDPETIIERITEFYDLAEESLAQQIERHESDSAIAGRDQPVQRAAPERTAAEERSRQSGNGYRNGNARNGNGHSRTNEAGQSATNKQIQFLLTLGKREGLTTPQLEKRVADILGRQVGLYDLTKQEAGVVLDSLTAGSSSNSRR